MIAYVLSLHVSSSEGENLVMDFNTEFRQYCSTVCNISPAWTDATYWTLNLMRTTYFQRQRLISLNHKNVTLIELVIRASNERGRTLKDNWIETRTWQLSNIIRKGCCGPQNSLPGRVSAISLETKCSSLTAYHGSWTECLEFVHHTCATTTSTLWGRFWVYYTSGPQLILVRLRSRRLEVPSAISGCCALGLRVSECC